MVVLVGLFDRDVVVQELAHVAPPHCPVLSLL